jgi:hypothetical protein
MYRDHSQKVPSSSKSMVLRKNVLGHDLLGLPLNALEFQEINEGVLGSTRTGSMR